MLVHAQGAGLVALSEGADIAAHPSGGSPLRPELYLSFGTSYFNTFTGEDALPFYC